MIPTEPQAFYPKRTCTYQQHATRIATMLQEGLHDGKAWKPESHARYAELEDSEAAAEAAPLRPQSAEQWLARQGLADLSLYWPTNKPLPQVDYASERARPTLIELLEAYARAREETK